MGSALPLNFEGAFHEYRIPAGVPQSVLAGAVLHQRQGPHSASPVTTGLGAGAKPDIPSSPLSSARYWTRASSHWHPSATMTCRSIRTALLMNPNVCANARALRGPPLVNAAVSVSRLQNDVSKLPVEIGRREWTRVHRIAAANPLVSRNFHPEVARHHQHGEIHRIGFESRRPRQLSRVNSPDRTRRRSLGQAESDGYRHGDAAGAPGQVLRALLHHERARARDRAGGINGKTAVAM